jgi:hypothetical protein
MRDGIDKRMRRSALGKVGKGANLHRTCDSHRCRCQRQVRRISWQTVEQTSMQRQRHPGQQDHHRNRRPSARHAKGWIGGLVSRRLS